MKIYHYPGCSTCKKAIAFLKRQNVTFEAIHIVESPPSKAEISEVAAKLGGDLKRMFNTSGEVYRELKLKDRLASMGVSEQIDLLAKNGKLIKRPLLVSETTAMVGFRESEWEAALRPG